MILAPVPMLDVALDRGAAEVRGPQTDGDERGDRRAGVDLDGAVDHDLAVDHVDAGVDDDRVADGDLREPIASRCASRGSTGTPCRWRLAFRR